MPQHGLAALGVAGDEHADIVRAEIHDILAQDFGAHVVLLKLLDDLLQDSGLGFGFIFGRGRIVHAQ